MLPIFINNLKAKFDGDLTGKIKQRKMLISLKNVKKKPTKKHSTKKASVLITLYRLNKNWFFFLTKRSEMVEHHKSQISLPGSRVNKSESLWEAATRGTYEEIGVQNINYIGSLTPLYLTVSNFHIYPFVGWVTGKPVINVNYSEVPRKLKVPISNIASDSIIKEDHKIIDQRIAKIPFFSIDNEMVLGATAAFLNEF